MEEGASKRLRILGLTETAKTFEAIINGSAHCPQSGVEEVIPGNLHPGMREAVTEGAEGEEGEVDVEEAERPIGHCRVRERRHGIGIDCRNSVHPYIPHFRQRPRLSIPRLSTESPS